MSKKSNALQIIGAEENNLKKVTLSIPHDELTVITGLSGSGKSSLAFDTVYAEGQRRYIETFSPYTRQFFDKVKKPLVEKLSSVRPAIAIQQRTKITSARSTVGSLTNCNDYLKVIWGALAVPHCPTCGEGLIRWDTPSIADEVKKILSAGAPSLLIATDVHCNKKFIEFELDRLKTLGFSRMWDEATSSVIRIEDVTKKDLKGKDVITVILDRVSGAPQPSRLRNSIDQGFSLNSKEVVLYTQSADQTYKRRVFSKDFRCEKHEFTAEIPKGSLFSFNHPLGACSQCKGFGHILTIAESKVVPDVSKSLTDHAIASWSGPSANWEYKHLLTFCKREGISVTTPWKDLAVEDRERIFNHKEKEYWGVLPWFRWLETKTYKMHVRVFLSRYREQTTCPSCGGSRLKPQALVYRINGFHIGEIWTLPISELLPWVSKVIKDTQSKVTTYKALQNAFDNLRGRLQYLTDLGLSYLTLERQAKTLSGGETQRVNLATALGSELTSTQFVLDEPSVGLHPRDSDRLTVAIKNLTKKQNSLLVVEHDPDVITEADTIIEVGPLAGKQGGEIVYNGPADGWKGLKIKGRLPTDAKKIFSSTPLKIQKASARNLKSFDVSIPLHALVCLTGVSGSGKSSFAHEVLLNAWKFHSGELEHLDSCRSVKGFEQIDEMTFVDQSPLAKTPRANIATYTKMWDAIRDLLAQTDAAVAIGLSKSSFSFNVNAGRCTSCEGAGFIREDMQFLSDVFVPCETCLGKRFQPTVLSVEYNGKNVDDFLSMTVDEALVFFEQNAPRGIIHTLTILKKLGLGACRLGHPLSELSGGEAQRLKLAPYLADNDRLQRLFIFDEPTTGLHVHDVENFVVLLRDLIERGHSVVCIEHNLSVIQNADWVIDLGPEGGQEGGHLLYEGEIAGLLKLKNSSTGFHLKKYIEAIKNTIKAPKRNSASKIKEVISHDLTITGAREHNLKNITVTVPTDKIVAITGVSGSGKSTLAKDIIYAEGQRRYLDCLSPYARQFIKELKKPDIDSIINVRPTICVYQHTFQPSALSTVATMSEVYNFLRLLFSKTGTQFCPSHPDQRIAPLSASEIAHKIINRKEKIIRLLSPVINQKKGNHQAVILRALESEISELRVDGMLGKTSHFTEGLVKSKVHSVDYVIAKFNPKTINKEALIDTIENALSLGGGNVIVLPESGTEEVLSAKRSCPICETGFFKIDPEDLSFNSKRGRCTTCDGFGVDDKGAVCSECDGSRIKAIGRNVRIDGLNIYECTKLSPSELLVYLKKVKTLLPAFHEALATPVIQELDGKLATLIDLGLGYVSLARSCRTLSGGELQRLRLATAMGSPLSGVMYIFDEPSAGLHPYDNRLVLKKLRGLQENNNAVIVIEHDIESITSCDYIIDVGPLAGVHGGEIVYEGDVKKYKETSTPTGLALALPHKIAPRATAPTDWLELKNGTYHSVKNISAKIPLHQFVTIGGVSGAGKSTLIHEIVAHTLNEGVAKKGAITSDRGSLTVSSEIDKIIYLDQKPIGSTSRSTPASYLGIWDEIRKVFAGTLEARAQGWNQGFFSYNSGKGRCQECKGAGVITLEMNFLADAKVECEACNGSRYTNDIQIVRYGGRTISEVLNLTFEEAKSAFANHRKIHHILKVACDLGLGYLKLGQSSVTLSGGESQRLKIVSELSGAVRGHTLYILDEPTLGLHRSDVFRLIQSLRSLVERGASVFVIEHDIDTIASSDYFIEMGPGAGEKGGKIIAQGSPFDITKKDTPWGSLLKSGYQLNSDDNDTFRASTR